MSDIERRGTIEAFRDGRTHVLCNVFVPTDGFDHPSTSCVVLLRPSSRKSTLIQTIGRGERTVDPGFWPRVVKTDCMILDFGNSTTFHRSIEQDVELTARGVRVEMPTEPCPGCSTVLPAAVRKCPLYGYFFVGDPKYEEVDDCNGNAAMQEIYLMRDRSNFLWVDTTYSGQSMVGTGIDACVGAFEGPDGIWCAVGGLKGAPLVLLSVGTKVFCLAAAADYLNTHMTTSTCHKTRS